jgi:DNA end-binding protein Ku
LPEAKPPAAPVRPFWSGTITFGLVSIPVDLLAAVTPRRKSMKLVDAEGHALGRRYYCPKDDRLLRNDELVRGFETDTGKVVVISDAEFESAAPAKSRDIELKRFVALDAIPPFFFQRPFFLAPDQRAGKAYALLAQTMARSGKVGIGSFVMREHEYLVAILADHGVLRAEVLRYADELRTPESVGLPQPRKADAAATRALAQAIDALSKPALDMVEMQDVDAEELLRFAQQKAKSGQGVIAMADLEDVDEDRAGSGEVIDLMQVLRKSLGAAAGRASRADGPAAGRAAPARPSRPVTSQAATRPPAAAKAAKKAPARQRPDMKTHARKSA